MAKKKAFESLDLIFKLQFNEERQINLTPTLALLLGIPIPYSNLGIAILDMFDESNKPDVIKANFLQVHIEFFMCPYIHTQIPKKSFWQ